MLNRSPAGGFSGSYRPEDVTFLLEAMDIDPTPVDQKEHLIQSGARHYSEMIAPEAPPDETYLKHFRMAFERNHRRVAQDIAALARRLEISNPSNLVLVSLARAGTPVGVLLKRALEALGHPVPHYSVSIIRDRGIDRAALDAIIQAHPDGQLRFVDGWTGKGAIQRELSVALAEYAEVRGIRLNPELIVLADLAGVATLAASGDDYLIPSAVLNAVISGLVSRSILNDEVARRGRYHGCVFFREMAPFDLSNWYVDAVSRVIKDEVVRAIPSAWDEVDRAHRRSMTDRFIHRFLEHFDLNDRNRIKPGIGEATRALLRRVPDRILLRDREGPETLHLVHLAQQKNVPIETWPDMPYEAVTIIRRLGSRHRPWAGEKGNMPP